MSAADFFGSLVYGSKTEVLKRFLVHSDRGVQYASKFTNVIDSYKMIIISRVEKLLSITVWSLLRL
jgi:hypothetical protein